MTATDLELLHDFARDQSPDAFTALVQVTRPTTIDVVRREASRKLREQIASEMNVMNTTADDWKQVEPLLDDAMHNSTIPPNCTLVFEVELLSIQ